MTDTKRAALDLAIAKAVKGKIAQVEGTRKHDMDAVMDPGDRITATLDNGTKVASVSKVAGARKATVADEDAFTAWVAENYRTEITQSVRESFRKAVLGRVAEFSGEVVDTTTGQVVPGVAFAGGEPYVRVDQRPDQADAVAAAWIAGLINGDPLREIGP